MARDGWARVAMYLRADEAELLRGVLESAGIPVMVEDAAISALNPLLQSAVGGAKVLVPDADAARASAIISETGLLGGPPGSAEEIPEEEWSAGASPEGRPDGPEARGPDAASALVDGGERAAGHALRTSFVALALAGTLILPVYAITASLRALRAATPTHRARVRSRWALAVSVVALGLGLAGWSTVFPGLRRVDPKDQGERLPPRPRGHPAPP